jgi:hypothetical protein
VRFQPTQRIFAQHRPAHRSIDVGDFEHHERGIAPSSIDVRNIRSADLSANHYPTGVWPVKVNLRSRELLISGLPDPLPPAR